MLYSRTEWKSRTGSSPPVKITREHFHGQTTWFCTVGEGHASSNWLAVALWKAYRRNRRR